MRRLVPLHRSSAWPVHRPRPVLALLLALLALAVAGPAAASADAAESATVSGRIVGPDGEPVAGAVAGLLPPSLGGFGGWQLGIETGAEGTFSGTVPAGTYRLHVSTPFRYLQDWFVGQPIDGLPLVTVAAGEVRSGLVVRLRRRPQYTSCIDGERIDGYDGVRPDGVEPGCPPPVLHGGPFTWDHLAVIHALQGGTGGIHPDLVAAGFTRESLLLAGRWIIDHPDDPWPWATRAAIIAQARNLGVEAYPRNPSPAAPAPVPPSVALGVPTRVPTSGSFRLPVTCVAGTVCSGTVVVTARVAGPRAAGRVRTVTVARARVRARTTATAAARLRLNRTGRRLLRRGRGALRVTVVWRARAADAPGRQRTVRLRAER